MFQRFFKKKTKDNRGEVLNVGLQLALAFGKSWQVPIQSRLGKHYPSLSESELYSYNLLCQDAMKCAHETICQLVQVHGKDITIEQFEVDYIAKYPWVNKKSIKSLFSQSMYYALKD